MKDITADDVIRSADVTAKHAMARLTDDVIMLHNRGYHAYSAAMGNMKDKIEQALSELVEELIP